ncbi:MAG: ACP S-malonyltransferase [Bacteroidales bacterium]|jgi:[acyl-carrier-protein] S-malonyltransferase|nr:ACP S-malonyltransferase [Bacteroidales bacterium]
MNKVGLLFPGQGSQYIGMGIELYNEIPEAKKVMDDSIDILGFDIRKIIFEGLEEELVLTQIAQPAIFIVSAMYFEKFKMMNKSFDVVAGHSLGEYAALYTAGVFSFEKGLRLVKKRGLVMSKMDSMGTMFVIMGVGINEIEKYLEGFERKVVIANINSKSQIVISGYTDETTKVANKLALIEDSTVKQLNVSGAFHSPLMREVRETMEKEIESISFDKPSVEVIPNVLGYGTKDIGIIKDSLKRQVIEKVKWLDTITYIKKMGIEQLYEVGPGDVLTKLNKTITFRPQCYKLPLYV